MDNYDKKRYLDEKKTIYTSKINEIVSRYFNFDNDFNKIIKVSEKLSQELFDLGPENLKEQIKEILLKNKIYEENLNRDLFIYHNLKININPDLKSVNNNEELIRLNMIEKSIYKFNSSKNSYEKTLTQFLEEEYPTWNSDFISRIVSDINIK